MIWLNPLALFALTAIAAPILIHILVQRRAERFAFPTLRFLQPTRLAAIRRHVLEDAALLAVRAAILAAAVAALAGPLVVTAVRRQVWERRIVRALVVDDVARRLQPSDSPRTLQLPDGEPERVALHLSQQFTGGSLRDSLRRAVAWLEKAPPARRELVIVSPFAIGSVDAADVAQIPASIGIRFERRGELPPTRTVAAGQVIGPGSPKGLRYDPLVPQPFRAARGNGDLAMFAREVTFAGAQTTVRDVLTTDPPAWPIDVVHPPEARAPVDAAKTAVLEQHVWAPRPDRRVRLVIGTAAASGSATSDAIAMSPWMGEAAAHIGRDREVQVAASRVATGLGDARFSATPWQTLASAADGRPLLVVAGGPAQLIVVSAANASDIATPLVMRSIATAVAMIPALRDAEVMPIADRQLQEWSRPAAAPAAPSADALRDGNVDDDRRWLWLAVLCLIGAETWMRRARNAAAEHDRDHREEAARVA